MVMFCNIDIVYLVHAMKRRKISLVGQKIYPEVDKLYKPANEIFTRNKTRSLRPWFEKYLVGFPGY